MADLADLLAKVQQAAQDLKEKQQAVEDERTKLQRDKEAVADEQLKFASIVSLNVGGARFDTTRTTLTACPGSLLTEMFSGRHAVVRDANNCVFIDRDPMHFRAILNWLRDYPDGVVPLLSEAARLEFIAEAKYYRLPIGLPRAQPPPPTTCHVDVESRQKAVPPEPVGTGAPRNITASGAGGFGCGVAATTAGWPAAFASPPVLEYRLSFNWNGEPDQRMQEALAPLRAFSTALPSAARLHRLMATFGFVQRRSTTAELHAGDFLVFEKVATPPMQHMADE